MSSTGSSKATPAYDRAYHSGGFGYESDRRAHERWADRHYIRSFSLARGSTLLDVPCGDGFWTALFARAGFKSRGVDLSPGGIDVAQSRYPGIDFRVGNAEEELPGDPETFDVVFSRGISHLHRSDLSRPGTARVAENLMRQVSPGGILLVSYWTRRDGSGGDRHYCHPVSDLVELFEPWGDPFKIEVVDDFVQIGLQHRASPRVTRQARWRRAAGAVRQALPR